MKHVGKTLSKLFAVLMTATLVFAAGCGGESEEAKQKDFIKEIGGVSETYVGEVSDESYNTSIQAAQTYVRRELTGDAPVNIIRTTTKAELTPDEIAALDVPASVKVGLDAVKEMELTYTVDPIATMSTQNERKVKVYVMQYGDIWKYYTPCPVTGQTVTRGYYDSVFNYEKYQNCTVQSDMEMEMTMKMSAAGYSQTVEMSMEIEQLIKYTNGRIYIEQTLDTETSGVDLEYTMRAYFEYNEYGADCYVNMPETGNQWIQGDLEPFGFEDRDDLVPFYDQYLDYTYFTKTEYGFELSGANAEQYINETFAQAEEFEEIAYLFRNMQIDMFAKFYVSGGVLSGVREDASLKMSLVEDDVSMDVNMDIEANITCTNYGTTVVNKPF